MMRTARLLAPLFAGALSLPVAAQALELEAAGGSMPGPLTLDAHPGLYPFELVVIIPSTTAGPTPLQLIDPLDFRSLDVGLDLLSLMWLVLTDFDGHGVVQVPLGSNPALVDAPLYFQAVTLQWLPNLVDRISNGNVVRLGLAGSFRDRAVEFFDDRAFATALVRPDRKVMLVGGARGQLLAQVAWSSTELYDAATDTFSYGPSLNAARSLHTMTQLQDGRWLVAGGVNFTNDPQATCEIYDPVADTFTPVASMGTPRMGHTATLLADGRVLVTGGIQAMPITPTQLEPIHQTVATSEYYDPIADSWSAGPNLSKPRAGHIALERPDGKILFCGGISWDPNIIFGWVPAVRSSCDLYDPTGGTMSAGPAMNTARALADPVELAPGRWLVAGGMNGLSIIPYNPGNPTAAAEIYDAATNSWTSVGSMATARANHKGWAIGNGRFLLAGGGANSILSPTPLSSTEIFDTATNTFSPGPQLNSERAGATAIRTPQGQMMLLGGASATAITRTTEWYYF
ncbi:MAG: kelch repeat-containing protein [Planctomycetota bacterium]